MRKKRPTKSIGKILNHRLFVVLITVLTFFIGSFLSKAQAQDIGNYQFGSVFQYYMLDNRANALQKDSSQSAKDQNPSVMDVAKKVITGQIGSGGVQGTFSYDDMVSSAPDDIKDADKTAENFASMMATYSAFHYMSNDIQGFHWIVNISVRVLIGLLLIIPAILEDVGSLLSASLLKIVIKFNPYTFLSNIVSKTQFASKLQEALGLSSTEIATFSHVILVVFSITILITLFLVLYGMASGKSNTRALGRLKGQVLTAIILPLTMVLAGDFVTQLSNKLTPDQNSSDVGFGRYFVDDKSWAYNFNFAPVGYDATQSSDIKPSNRGSYVDLDFDPYTQSGADRISQINSHSSYLGDGATVVQKNKKDNRVNLNEVFSNTTALYVYASGQTFSAQDYINYKGTQVAENSLLGGGNEAKTVGAYYNYAQDMKDNGTLLDVKKSYTGSGLPNDDNYAEGPFKKDIKDYDDGKDGNHKLNTSASAAWRDRYIYGAKTGGDMSTYYGEAPSEEMLHTTVGAGEKGNSLSDQSMFLVLSTIFNGTGGSYNISAPARGGATKIASFDSNRSDYYVMSLTGIWLFSALGLMATPIIKLIVLWTMIVALISIGIIDMIWRPIRVALKGMMTGKLEYAGAYVIYAVGFVGNVFEFVIAGSLIERVLNAVGNTFSTLSKLSGFYPQNPDSSMIINGIGVALSAGFSIALLIIYKKNKKFRGEFISLFTFAWGWARSVGDQIESRVSSGGEHVFRKHGNRVQTKISSMDDKLGQKFMPKTVQKYIRKADEEFDERFPHLSKVVHYGDRHSSGVRTKDPKDIQLDGMMERANNTLGSLREDPSISVSTENQINNADKYLKQFHTDPHDSASFLSAEQGMVSVKESILKDGASDYAIGQIDNSLKEMNQYGIKNNLISDDSKSPVDFNPDKVPVVDPNELSKNNESDPLWNTDPLNKNSQFSGVSVEDNYPKDLKRNSVPHIDDKETDKQHEFKNSDLDDLTNLGLSSRDHRPDPLQPSTGQEAYRRQSDNNKRPNVTNVNHSHIHNDNHIKGRQNANSAGLNKRNIPSTDKEVSPLGKTNAATSVPKNGQNGNSTSVFGMNQKPIRTPQNLKSQSPVMNNINHQSMVNNYNKQVSINPEKQVVTNQQIKNVNTSLGKAAQQPEIQEILKKLRSTNQTKEFDSLSTQLHKNISQLDKNMKSGVNGQLLNSNLDDIKRQMMERGNKDV